MPDPLADGKRPEVLALSRVELVPNLYGIALRRVDHPQVPFDQIASYAACLV